MADQPIISSAEEPPRRTRLESWKAVAAHFGRDVTTVRRWERREGLPIHRLFHEKLGSIYAYSDELDAWWAARRLRDTAGDAEPVSVTVDPPAASACVDEARPRRARATARRAIGWASAIAALSLLLTATPVTSRVTTWLDDARGVTPGAATGAAVGIAVLPLASGSGTAHEWHFSDGMTTALTTELAAVESLKVIAPTSMRRYRNRAGDSVAAIAHELGVDWMLEGSAQLNPGEAGTGPRVRIAVSLTRAATGQRLWAKQYDRPMESSTTAPWKTSSPCSRRSRAPSWRRFSARAYHHPGTRVGPAPRRPQTCGATSSTCAASSTPNSSIPSRSRVGWDI
jgi:TolB-like protein